MFTFSTDFYRYIPFFGNRELENDTLFNYFNFSDASNSSITNTQINDNNDIVSNEHQFRKSSILNFKLSDAKLDRTINFLSNSSNFYSDTKALLDTHRYEKFRKKVENVHKSNGSTKMTEKFRIHPEFSFLRAETNFSTSAHRSTRAVSVDTNSSKEEYSRGNDTLYNLPLHCQKPQYVVYTWVLCMIILGGFLKLKYIVKTVIVFLMVAAHIVLLLAASDASDFIE